uniref:Methyltransferase domain-containing protein n=1 Tax=Candidatus Kentrum sp. FM TaxID=2126340 RepID=A0A450S5X7_9GAMM|nr:MAG: Methyltransferase domain-containing protein [Candidatus Kentron sp. FM]VFJ47524.1 MAG: Methyltransferase domain-containing protein [Candidatus Kentron sp. FM]VFK07812.1 MAG: Methyltransferase domain-containing protein [Candidatus Kentron sp. FM]
MIWPRFHVLWDPQSWSYVARSGRGYFRRELRQCPCCGSRHYKSLSRKSLVTFLVRCSGCRLLYRIPQDPIASQSGFYQSGYVSGGLATYLPAPRELTRLLATAFRGTDKNFAQKIALFDVLGVPTGARVLDFGASWGYALWQLQKAGYDAMGYEIGVSRADFGRVQLGVEIVSEIDSIRGPFHVVFSSHVLEHLPNPKVAFELAKRLLRPRGLFIAFTPNGSEVRLRRNKKVYDHSWGRLHPIYLDAAFYEAALPNIPKLITSRAYGNWRNIDDIAGWDGKTNRIGDLSGPEMMLVWSNDVKD